MTIDRKLNRKIRLLNSLMGIPRDQSYSLMKSSRNRVTLMTPNDKAMTSAFSKNEMHKILDLYVKGMEDYKNRVRIRKSITRRRS